MIYEIPLKPSTPQRLRVGLPAITVIIALSWCIADEGGWIMDIADENGDPLVEGIALVTGVDLAAQYPDIGLPPMWITTDGDQDAPPTYDSLGVSSHLYFAGP